MNTTERVSRHRQKRRKQGLKRVEFWLTDSEKTELEALLWALRYDSAGDSPDGDGDTGNSAK